MGVMDLVNVSVSGHLTDISTAGQVFIPVTEELQGEVIEIRTAINGAIATGDAVLTPKINGTAMTNGAITVTQSGSAAGDVDVSRPTSNRTIAVGDAIEIETDGASTNTVSVSITLTIRR